MGSKANFFAISLEAARNLGSKVEDRKTILLDHIRIFGEYQYSGRIPGLFHPLPSDNMQTRHSLWKERLNHPPLDDSNRLFPLSFPWSTISTPSIDSRQLLTFPSN